MDKNNNKNYSQNNSQNNSSKNANNNSNNNGFADQIDLLTPMLWEEVEEWANKPIGKRGDDYVTMKNNKTKIENKQKKTKKKRKKIKTK